jgi:hypothetical protein
MQLPGLPLPPRPRSGNCRFPDPPAQPLAPLTRPNLLRTHSGNGARGIRRKLLELYNWHRIRERHRIVRWLPKLYVAWCRRHGYIDRFWDPATLQPTPATQITADTEPTLGFTISWEVLSRIVEDRRTDRDRPRLTGRSPARRRRQKMAQQRAVNAAFPPLPGAGNLRTPEDCSGNAVLVGGDESRL